MENYEEELFNTDNRGKVSWTPFLRQVFVGSGITIYFFIHGLFIGAPTVYIPQIRKEANSTQVISIEMASWLSSLSFFTGIPASIVLPVIAQKFGRQTPFLILWLTLTISSLMFYCSTSVTELIISTTLEGMLNAAIVTCVIMVLTEYISPRYRGIFMAFKSASFYWGVWVSNAIGTYFHWKNICILILICCAYNISTLFWPESPYWLAFKGRYEECSKIHRWLKGNDPDSEEELKCLIALQKEKFNDKIERRHSKRNYISKIYSLVRSKIFYKPLTFALLTISLYHFSGKLAYTVYAIDLLKKIIRNESTAYKGMLILDGITVCGMYVGCILTKLLRRRTLLLVSSTMGITFLFILSTYLYLIHKNIISENAFITLSLLTAFTMTIGCGPMLMSMCFTGELTPLKYRCTYLAVVAVSNNIIGAAILKLTPNLFKSFGPHGAFLFFAIISSIIICILYKYLPETKDKTILDIEKYMSDDEKVSKREKELLTRK